MKTVLLIGCDGYIGNAMTQRLLFKGYKVVGVDNFLRRNWIKNEMKSFSATPIMEMYDKEVKFKELGDFEFNSLDISKAYNLLSFLFDTHNPDIVINLGHIPSGPYSMISRDTANLTLNNNIIGTNNLLWLIKEKNPNAHYITIGTTGEYDHYSNIDIEEGYIQINHNGRISEEMIYPRRPGSIYHTSKTSSTYLIDFLARSWKLKCTDVQQSVVFGSYTDEIDQTKVYSRLDTDEAGGTVVNRFIVQALLDIPLTIYGEGSHQRGFISLNDSIQAMMLAVENEAEPGKVQVWNQLSEWYSMTDIANMVVNSAGKVVNVTHIPTPRNEYTGDHYYHYVTKKLKALGYAPTRTIEQEIQYTMGVLDNEVSRLQPLRDVVIPKIKWC